MNNIEETTTRILGKMIVLHCDKHGEYFGYEKCRMCPSCAQEAEDDSRRKKESRRKYEVSQLRWKQSGLPVKFCSVGMDDWIADTPDKEAAKKDAEHFIRGYVGRMMFIGNCGTGKTMLAAAIIGEMALHGRSPVYSTAIRLIRSIRDSWRDKETLEQEVMDRYIKADVLVVDELGAGRCTEDDKLILSEILCDRYSMDMPTLLISNLTAKQIKERALDERAIDRMREGGEVVRMHWKSERGIQ